MSGIDDMAEYRAFSDVLTQADRACQLTHTLNQLMILRNRPQPEMDPDRLSQRRAILELTIRITKIELKRVATELSNALSKWGEEPDVTR